MSGNNYYGFTHAGTQYGTQYTASAQYTPGGTVPGAAYPPPPPPPPPDPYNIGGYTRSVSQTPANKAGGGGGYSNYSGTPNAGAAGGFNATQQQQTPTPPKPPGSFTNYDAAVYNAVSAYAHGSGFGFPKGGRGGAFNRKGPRPPPKQLTLHFCDVCKISCAGPQTYKEHLDGQKHKKREILLKSGSGSGAAKTGSGGGFASLLCELCDVTCSGNDAYAAHIRGAKHQKVLKLLTKLGKPIPTENPTLLSAPAVESKKLSPSAKKGRAPKPPPPPKIQFMSSKAEGERFLSTDPNGKKNDTGITPEQAGALSTAYPLPLQAAGNGTTGGGESGIARDEKGEEVAFFEKEIEPVGGDYIEELRTDDGKGFTFNCKLCDCKFNDPNAKEMHMKGRRHRLQYKKKVDPKLVVDIKPSSIRMRKDDFRSPKNRRGLGNSDANYSRHPPIDQRQIFPGPRFRMPLPPGGPPVLRSGGGGGGGGFYGGGGPLRRPESRNDKHVMVRHGEIYPLEEELQAIQRIVSTTERALKFVSDELATADCKAATPPTTTPTTQPIVKVEASEEGGESEEKVAQTEEVKVSESELQNYRILKGVMRVGNLAKGLLLRGDRVVELVVLCSVKPTLSILQRVASSLPSQLTVASPEEKYTVLCQPASSGLIVKCEEAILPIEVKITLTSPLIRTQGSEGEARATGEPDDLLDKGKCLDALAALRHAKWFQARATALHSCVIVIRIMRDLCQRNEHLKGLTQWVIELVSEKALSSSNVRGPVGPGEGLTLVFEVLSSGLILPGSRGILDPCEKEPSDALSDSLSPQDRINITRLAQEYLRMMSFGQVHKIVGVEELPRFKDFQSRKRRRNNSANGESETTNEQKKEKVEESMDTTPPPQIKTN